MTTHLTDVETQITLENIKAQMRDNMRIEMIEFIRELHSYIDAFVGRVSA